MRKLLFIAFALKIGVSAAQTFTIPAEKQPYYEIIEWKGMGGIIMSKDPTGVQGQINLSSIQQNGKTEWTTYLNPLSKNPIQFISEEGGKYAYFLEKLEPEFGKIQFHQLTQAGTLKFLKADFSLAIKKLGNIDLNELETIDIVSTQKALVYLFRYDDKANKKLMTIAATMTHNNSQTFANLVAENVASSSKVENLVSWYIAGENGDNIIYAARTSVGKESGWKVKEVGPKGNTISEFTISGSGVNFLAHSRVGFGRRGSALLNKVELKEAGTLLYSNGTYYVGGIEMEGTTANLNTYKWTGQKFEKICTSIVTNYNAKKELAIGFMQLTEGIAWYVKNVTADAHMHQYNNATGFISSAVNQTTSNPSRLITDKFPAKFVSSLTDKWLVFDPKQLPVKGELTFEYIAK